MGNLHVRFLEGWAPAMAPGYSNLIAIMDGLPVTRAQSPELFRAILKSGTPRVFRNDSLQVSQFECHIRILPSGRKFSSNFFDVGTLLLGFQRPQKTKQRPRISGVLF